MTVVQMTSRIRGSKARSRTRAKWVAGHATSSYYLVIGASGLLLLLGLIMILSASSVMSYAQHGSSFWFFERQLAWAGLGVAALAVFSRLDYHRLRPLGWAISGMGILALLAVLHPAIGTRVSGSSRWIGAGPIRFQPSELMKIGLLILAADLVARKQGRMHSVKEIAFPLGVVVALTFGLIMLQPDLGTTLIIGLIVFAVIFVGGTSLPIIGGMGLAGVAGAMALSYGAGYRRARLLSFMHPFSDPLNSGYQAVQSMIALGSGGIFGVGLGQSRQKWMYVPNAHTDFIFAILGEELGLIGTLAVIALFITLAYAGVRVANRAPDAFGRLLAFGATAWIVGQAVVNMGAVTGLLPITGVPLPLVSFGGSALVFTLVAVGILANVARQERPRTERGTTGRTRKDAKPA